MAPPDRRSRLELERFLAGFERDAATHYDLEGLAVYQLDPTSFRTAILCPACRFIALVPTIPRRRLVHECSRCRRSQRLTPPLAVLTAARAPVLTPRLRPS